MKTKLNKSLQKSLQSAVSSYDTKLNEEQGGFILKHPADDVYEYISIRNSNTGTDIAVALYTADKNEFAKKVLSKFLKGYTIYASYHTHPKGCAAMPSYTDLTELFTGHPINFIYAPHSKTLNVFTYNVSSDADATQAEWYGETIKL